MNPILRVFLSFLATLSFILGVIGIFVPLLPTTPLIILSAFIFSKSSPRFHDWLLQHPYFGRMIADWRNHRVINNRAKALCFFMISLSLYFIFQSTTIPDFIKFSVIAFLSLLLIFVLTRKSHVSIVILILLWSDWGNAAIEFSANYWQSRQKFGEERDSISLSQTYAGSFAWYLLKYTALEVGFSRTQDTISNKEAIPVDSSFTILESENIIRTDVANISLKQSLAPRTALLVPALSFGYAKQWISGETRYFVDDTGVQDSVTLKNTPLSFDSCIAGASLRIRLTQLIGLTGSYRSVMRDCNMKYSSENTQVMAGLSWIF